MSSVRRKVSTRKVEGYFLTAKNIKAENVFGLLEDAGKVGGTPLVAVEFQGVTKKTEATVPGDTDITWNETLEWDLDGRALEPDDSIKIRIFSQEKYWKNKLLGKAQICLDELVVSRDNKVHVETNLCDGSGDSTEYKLSCELEYIYPELKEDGERLDFVDGEEAEEDFEKAGAKSRSIETRPVRSIPNNPMDFQIRIKIIEARQLEGNNINPVVRVTIGKQKRQTRVRHSTDRPYYNETFFFQFSSITPDELFKKEIIFEVFNTRLFRADSLIGYFKCDVGFVYDQKGSMLLRKWLVITEMEDRDKGGLESPRDILEMAGSPAGYVKTSMVVLVPGATAPSLDVTCRTPGEDDVETNVLHPPGVTLTKALFKLKVYRAEDLPQMDSSIGEHIKKTLKLMKKEKDLVDPYCVFSFAGNKATSEIIYSNNHPCFNEILNVPFQFPSMCDQLKIQLVDWDRLTADDIIGTKFSDLSAISGNGGAGFLPTFGPCYINLYGSRREYTELADEYEDLNKGIGEGAAYRGRILVALETKLNEDCESEKEPIPQGDIVKVQPFMRRSKFLLRVIFLEATMLSVQDSPVEFEVSIGNYGNKLNNSFSPSSSTTPPTNPMFDGDKYHFLPWGETKPCVPVDSHWEDITFRLATLNKLLKICDRLEKNIGLVRIIQSKGELQNGAKVLKQILDQLTDDCRPLKKLDLFMVGVTSLDLLTLETRNLVLAEISDKVETLLQDTDDIDNVLKQVEGFLKKLRTIAVEPQNSIPDVIIWMLKGGTERVAYCRIPAYQLLYSPDEEERGVHCGKIIDISLKYLWKRNSSHAQPEIPALLRVMLRFGREQDHGEWDELKKTGGELSLYAETYENQMWFGQWTSKGLSRHAFSNAKGTLSLPKDKFLEPPGWEFGGDWFVSPELSTQYSRDMGHNTFQEDAFQNEYRMYPGGKWLISGPEWTDNNGEPLTDQGEVIKNISVIKPPVDWIWVRNSSWAVDFNRAVDENGWEYAVEISFGSSNFESVEKKYHFCRRRRFVRERRTVQGPTRKISVYQPPPSLGKSKDGWAYANTFNGTFRATRKGFAMVRRRRWHRKLIRTDPQAVEPILTVQSTGKTKDEDEPVLNAPRIFLAFKEPHLCQLRVHLYQAKNILPSDPNGLADPYVQLSFGTRSATSKIVFKKLNPSWDQMLILENIPIYGHHDQIVENPPDVVLELFDYDPVGKHDVLGRVQTEPLVILPDETRTSPTKLMWYKIMCDQEHCGDILAAFELFVDESKSAPPLPTPVNDLYTIPPEIRPAMQRTAIEVLCWGVRNLTRFRGCKIRNPIAEIEIGGEVRKTTVISNIRKNPNFEEQRLLFFDMDLPSNEMHILPITIRIRDLRSFGRSPTVGVCVLDCLSMYRWKKPVVTARKISRVPNIYESVLDIDQGFSSLPKVFKELDKEDIDWWSKYYASREGTADKSGNYPQHYDRLEVYHHELEKEFNNFQDFIRTFKLRRGKVKSLEDYDENTTVGEFKGAFCLYNLPEDRSTAVSPQIFSGDRLPQARPVNCLVRVYVIKAYDLTPQDIGGQADPYLIVSLGKQYVDERDKHASNTLEVDFGRMFEFNVSIPVEKDLRIRVMDYDLVSADDLIGETVIDLENRMLSLNHAIAGLPATYSVSGPNEWRLGSTHTPTTILETYCKFQGLDMPRYTGANLVMVNHNAYSLQDFEERNVDLKHLGPEKERLALYVLHSFNKLVPEHVETRDLMSPLQPGFSQGKLEMFVDIFPEYFGPPAPPIDISPRQAKQYELRVIIWNTKDVYLQESNLAGEKMSDIYVKCWLSGIDKKQSTDIHYRSLNGEGMFNWRMAFPFEFLDAEKFLVVKKKEHFWNLSDHSDKLRAQLILQVWDNDLISFDDFIGAVVLDLDDLPMPFSSARKIKDHNDLLKCERQSLFAQRRVYGWWPVQGMVKDKSHTKKGQKPRKVTKLTGKVEMTLELIDNEVAEQRPVGLGQDEPNQHPVLTKPKRPATSFLWFANPWKSFRHIVWRNYKWYIIGLIFLILILLVVFLFLYAAPGYSVKKLMGT